MLPSPLAHSLHHARQQTESGEQNAVSNTASVNTYNGEDTS